MLWDITKNDKGKVAAVACGRQAEAAPMYGFFMTMGFTKDEAEAAVKAVELEVANGAHEDTAIHNKVKHLTTPYREPRKKKARP